jgi:signal transduction histidine kinase
VTISIRARVLAAFLLLITMAGLETALVLYVQREAEGALVRAQRAQQLLHDNDEIGRALAGMQAAQRGFLITGSSEELSEYDARYRHYRKITERIPPLIVDDEQRERFARIQALVEDWRVNGSDVLIERRRKGEDVVAWLTVVAVPRFRVAHDEIVAFEERQTVLNNDAAAAARDRLARTTVILTVTPLAGIMIILGLMVATNRTILRPLASLATSARRLAAADYDAALPPARHHEIGELVSAFAEMRSAVEQRAAKAAELDRMKDEFVAVVSHELRTPLTAIRGSLQLLLADPAIADAENRRLLEAALNSCERLVRIVSDMLDMSKIEAGRLILRSRRLSLVEIVQQSIDSVRQLAAQAAVAIADHVPHDLPTVIGDADRLTQAVINLLSNAVKFAPPRSTITVNGRADDRFVAVSVQDRGHGIAREDMDRLFHKFQQLEGPGARRLSGTGLGLVITKAIVEQHGGRIEVDSAVGEGSTFSIVLPRDTATRDTEAQRDGETTDMF